MGVDLPSSMYKPTYIHIAMDNSKLRDQAVEAIALWLNSEGWVFDTISCQFWQHPKLGQADDIWAALNRQLEA